jgi:MFS family permease
VTNQKLLTRNYILGVISNFLLFGNYILVASFLPLLLTQQGKEENIGWVTGIYSVTLIIGLLVGGWLSDTFGHRKVGLYSFFFLSLVTFVYMFADQLGLIVLVLIRFFHGAAHAVAMTSVISLVSNSIPHERKGRGTSYSGAIGMASIAIMPIFGLLIFQQSTIYWGISILLCAVLGFLSILKMRVTDDPVKKRFKLSNLVVMEKRVMFVSFAAIGVALVQGAVQMYIPLFALENHIPEFTMGSFLPLYAAGIIATRLFVGFKRYLDQGNSLQFVTPSLIIISLWIILLSTILNTFVFFGAAIFIGVGVGVIIPSFQTYVNKNASEEKLGAAFSTYFIFYEFGATTLAGVFLPSIAIEFGYTRMLWFTLPLLVLTYYLIRKLRKLDQSLIG